jgi:hypothetical protein
MHLTEIAEALTWQGDGRALGALRATYVDVLADALGRALARFQTSDPTLGAELADLARTLPDSGFARFLTAPETSCVLLWPRRLSPYEIMLFFRRALEAERARDTGGGAASGAEAWTALGDFCVHADGRTTASPARPGLPPLDFSSPHARELSHGSPSAAEYGRQARYDAEEAVALAEVIGAALGGIAAVDGRAAAFVASFTSVLMFVRSRAGSESRFSSRSPERHVGLSVLVDAHLPTVDRVDLAEALIHEAIHSVLDMHEACARAGRDGAGCWVARESLYDGAPRTVSPWTGTRLALPTYLHACFVWFGLVHFWSRSLGSGAFDGARVIARLRQALRGFLADDVLTQLDPFREAIRPDLLTALTGMRDQLVATFAGASDAVESSPARSEGDA